VVTFSCGGPTTIPITSTIVINAATPTTIEGTGQGVTLTGGAFQMIFVASGVSLSLNNLTITGVNNPGGKGGAILNAGTLSVTNTNFANNRVGVNGGAIYNAGTAIVTSSNFGNNGALAGAAISNVGTLSVALSTFDSNGDSTTLGGGAIQNSGPLTVLDSHFDRNRANEGGAIQNFAPGVIVKITSSGGCTFSNNDANIGGAIENSRNNTLSPPVQMVVGGCAFTGNNVSPLPSPSSNVPNGGAIYNFGATMTVVSSFFTQNQAQGSGGAIYNAATSSLPGSLSVLGPDSEFSFNQAIAGGGGAIASSTNTAGTLTTSVSNTYFVGNTARLGGGIENDTGQLTVDGSTLLDNAASGIVMGSTILGGGGGIDNRGPMIITNSSLVSNFFLGNQDRRAEVMQSLMEAKLRSSDTARYGWAAD
jgi:predicted outer membrane repeat protein